MTPAIDPACAFVVASPEGTIFSLSVLQALYGEASDVKNVLVDALAAGLVLPVYRMLDARVIDPSARTWTQDLMSLRRSWATSSGEDVDGADPEEVEVGFTRTARQPSASRFSAPSAIDQRRLLDGARALDATAQEPSTIAEVRAQLSLVHDGIAALQSLDDLGPEANARASADEQELWRRLKGLEDRLYVDSIKQLEGKGSS